jgi:hypothetical protein
MRHLAGVIIAYLCLAGTALAQEPPQPWRLNNIPLDMPREADLNGEYLEGIYQEKLMPRLLDSVGIPWPSYHIRSTLKGRDGNGQELMELYFSSPAEGERIFWVRLNSGPLQAGTDATGVLGMLEQNFGIADRLYAAPDQSGSTILLFVDPGLPEDQRQHVIDSLPQPGALSPQQFQDFWEMSLAERAQVLGVDFRGAIAIVNVWQGELKSLQTELLDMRGAASVYTLR